MFSRLSYTFREMWASLRRNFTLTAAAVITAAVHTYLGGSAHIQSIRRRPSASWAQQGRSFIQSLRNMRIKPKSHRQP